MALTQTGFRKDVVGSYIIKDPAAIITYTIDWEDWLSTGSHVDSSTWTISTVTGDGANAMSKVSDGKTNGDKHTYIELQKGTAGNTYVIKNTIVTSDGTTDVRRFRVRVEERYL